MWNIVRSAGSSILRPVIQAASIRHVAVLSSFYHSLCRSTASTFPVPLLAPQTVMNTQVAGLKVKGIVRRRCKDCSIYVIDERTRIYCKSHPRHNQAAKVKKHYNRWTLTHATMSKLRPY